MERRGRQDRVHGLFELQLEQVEQPDLDPAIGSGQPFPGRLHHRGGCVDGDDPSPGQALEKRLGDTPGATARIEDRLIARQFQPS